MIIIFLIIIILILLYFLLKNKDTFIIKNVIKGNTIINEDIIYDNTNIFLGKNDQQDFITFDTQFYFKVNVPKISDDNDKGGADSNKCPDSPNNWVLPNGQCCNPKFKISGKDKCLEDYKNKVDDSYFLNNAHMCKKQISDSICFKSNSDIVSDTLLLKGIPKKTNCIQSGCIPKTFNDDYCCSKLSITNLRCGKGYKNKSCVPNNKYKKEDGQCLTTDETMHNCKTGKDSRDGDCKDITKHPWKCGEKSTPLRYSSFDLGGIDEESINYNINDNTKSGLWKFIDVENKKEKFVYYGHEVLLQNISNITSFLCICDSTIDTIANCGKKVDIYCYNNKTDALNYGKWIIIPKFFNKFSDTGNTKTKDVLKDINQNPVDFDFYEDYIDDIYDFETLRDKKIPIQMNDKFLIINTYKINGRYVYLNFCSDQNYNLSLDCNNKLYKKVIGSFSDTTQLANFNENKLYIYNWSIVPQKYDINAYDTLYVDGSITLGDEDPIEITSDTLRYIKSIPYHFDKEICLKDENNMKNCINKEHIEILNGSRPINIESVVPSKPFILYSALNYTGREFRIGFEYDNTDNLPYIGNINEWLNPNDHGKWMSLKIEGPYSAIIFSKPNYGYDISSVGISPKITLENSPIQTLSNTISDKQALCYIDNNPDIKEATKPDVNLPWGSTRIEKAKYHWAEYGIFEVGTDDEKQSPFICDNTNNNSDKVVIKNPTQYLVNSPGITNVRDLGDKWNNGIRSIIFRYKNKDGEYKEIRSTTTTYEMKCLEKKQLLNQTKLIDSDVINTNIYTANLCKNGYDNQNFYLFNENDDKIVDSNIYDDIESNHIHFHKHPYDIDHD